MIGNVRFQALRVAVLVTLLAGVALAAESAGAASSLRKQQAVAVLKSAATGDTAAHAVVHPKYIQHNLSVPDDRSGFTTFLQQLPQGSADRVSSLRVFEDGEYVFVHTRFNFSRPRVAFDLYRFEAGQIVEHWDNFQDQPSTPNASGHTMIDGPVEPRDLDKTAANKALVHAFVDEVWVARRGDRLTSYLHGDTFVEHDPSGKDGLAGLQARVKDEALQYHRMRRLVGEGNFVMTISEGSSRGSPCAIFDLFRIENGKLAEHWSTVEAIPPRDQWKNSNGKF